MYDISPAILTLLSVVAFFYILEKIPTLFPVQVRKGGRPGTATGEGEVHVSREG